MFSASTLILLVLALGAGLISGEANLTFTPVLKTNFGPMRGIVQTTHDGKKVNAYLGVKYAHAWRFEGATLTRTWHDIYEATHARFVCPQFNVTYDPEHVFQPGELRSEYSSEDCLYLNIWVPAEEKRNRSVLVWIHGGGWKAGHIWEDVHDGRELASHGDVIVVSIAYRLGVFGTMPNPMSPTYGNYGISDQDVAIWFINRIINTFGGNHESITVFGESAGSGSTGMHLLNAHGLSYFQRAIMMSGAPIMLERSKEESVATALEFAKKVGCESKEMSAAIDCMRQLTAHQLMDKANPSLLDRSAFPISGKASPLERIKASDSKFDLIYGTVQNEGGALYEMFRSSSHNLTLDGLKVLMETLLKAQHVNNTEGIFAFYTKNLSNHTSAEDLLKIMAEAYGDMFISCPTLAFGEYLGRHPRPRHRTSKHYTYLFNQRNKLMGCRKETGMVCHASDVYYAFGMPLRYANKTNGYDFDEHDAKVSRAMMTAWTNFAKTGDPGTLEGTQWTPALQPTKDTASHYFEFNANNMKMGKDLFKERCDFWNRRWNIQM